MARRVSAPAAPACSRQALRRRAEVVWTLLRQDGVEVERLLAGLGAQVQYAAASGLELRVLEESGLEQIHQPSTHLALLLVDAGLQHPNLRADSASAHQSIGFERGAARPAANASH